jgi:hypothetical protein
MRLGLALLVAVTAAALAPGARAAQSCDAVEGHSVRATMPDSYEGACTPFVRSRLVAWNGTSFAGRMTARHRRSTPC